MDDRVAVSERRLKAAGMRITPQRRLILRILGRAGGHLDAAEIFERGRHHDTRLSLSTVYRTLNALKENDVVRELHLDDEHHHYELDQQDGHSHLVCLGCGRIVEVDSDSLAQVAKSLGRAHDFEITHSQVELTGYCARCRQRAAHESALLETPSTATETSAAADRVG
jgi:Fur family ferric uptake transcriptional regulator